MIISTNIVGGYSNPNIPGILNLYLIKKEDVLSVQDPIRHRIAGAASMKLLAGDLVLKVGTVVYRIKFPPLACSLVQTMERTEGGQIYTTTINFALPANQVSNWDFAQENVNRQFVCILEDANSRAYLVGNEERGLRFNTSPQIGGANQTMINLLAKLAIPTLQMETGTAGFVLADQLRDTDFAVDFSSDFNI